MPAFVGGETEDDRASGHTIPEVRVQIKRSLCSASCTARRRIKSEESRVEEVEKEAEAPTLRSSETVGEESRAGLPDLVAKDKERTAFLKQGGKSGITSEFGKPQLFDSDGMETVGGSKAEVVGTSETESVVHSKSVSVSAGETVDIETGKADLTVKKPGQMTIQGKNISAKGSAALNVKKERSVQVKGKRLKDN